MFLVGFKLRENSVQIEDGYEFQDVFRITIAHLVSNINKKYNPKGIQAFQEDAKKMAFLGDSIYIGILIDKDTCSSAIAPSVSWTQVQAAQEIIKSTFPNPNYPSIYFLPAE